MDSSRSKPYLLLFQLMRVLAFLAVFMVSGLCSVMVQTLAWANMLPAQIIATGSVSEAVEKTFSGEHPCSFCELAEAIRDNESTDSKGDEKLPVSQKDVLKNLKLTASANLIVLTRCSLFSPLSWENDCIFESRSWQPATPPPDFC